MNKKKQIRINQIFTKIEQLFFSIIQILCQQLLNIAQQEIKKQQQTFKKDLKGQKFTYDFDGKILNTKNIKSEKLPPANYAVHFTLKDENVIRNKETMTSKSIIKSMKEIDSKTNLPPPNLINTDYQKYMQMQQQMSQKEMQQKKHGRQSFSNLQSPSPQLSRQESQTKADKHAKNAMSVATPFEYDNFIPSQGVKLIYESNIKEGQRYKHDIQDLEQLDRQLRMHRENEPLHITKTEYRKLTENGNLNRNNTNPNINLKINSAKKQDKMNNILSPLKGELTNTFSRDYQTPKNSDFASGFKTESHKRAVSLHTSQNFQIKVENPDLIQGLLSEPNDETSEDINHFNTKKLPRINDRKKSMSQNKQSPNDIFNLHILEDQGWGKGKGGVYNAPDQRIKKPTSIDFKKSLNNLVKLPRERDLLATMKKQEQMINDQISQQLQSKSSAVKNMHLQQKDQAMQQGFKQTFYSTRSSKNGAF